MNSTDQPLVTVAVTCYNHAAYVEQALESVRSQTYPNVELLVTDDASTDTTQDVVRAWCERNDVEAQFVFHQVNTGFAAILNEVVPLASGSFFVTMSADDEMVPDRITRQLHRFRTAPSGCALVYSDMEKIDIDGKPLPDPGDSMARPPGPDPFATMLESSYVPAPTVMMRTEAVRALTSFEVITGGPYDEGLPFEDYDLWLRTARLYPIAYEPGELIRYRSIPTSVSNAAAPMRLLENRAMVLRKHLGIRRDYDRIIDGQFADRVAVPLYQLGSDPTLTRFALRRAVRARRSVMILACLVGAHLRIPYRRRHAPDRPAQATPTSP